MKPGISKRVMTFREAESHRAIKNCLLAMKLTVFLLTAFCLHVSAGVRSQNVTLSVNNQPLHQVLKAIKKQTDYTFFAKTDLLKKGNNVTVNLKNVSITEALDACFKNQPFTYSIDGNIIIVEPKQDIPSVVANSDRQPQHTGGKLATPISGRVVDADGKPLDGASVVIKNSKNSTKTDANGNFSLNAEVGQTLIISYVGYASLEIKVTSPTTAVVVSSDRQPNSSGTDDEAIAGSPSYRPGSVLNFSNGILSITLKQNSSPLDDAVVVAYSTTTQRRATSSFAVVKGEEIQSLPNRSFDRSLQGMVPGLQITQGNGQPGGGVSNFVLRGIATGGDPSNGATVRNPLIVVDGVPVFQDPAQMVTSSVPFNNPLAQLNPSDIETITVLKDAAAVALYGSRASNGVILVTTKKGKAGKTVFSFRSQADISHRPTGSMAVLNQQEYLQLVYETYKNTDPSWTDAAIKTDLFSKFPYRISGTDTSSYPADDWKEAIYKNGAATFTNEFSISGGNDRSNFYLNLEYSKQNGAAIATDFSRKSLRFNYENRPTDWFKIGLNTTLSHSIQNYSYEGSSEYAALLVSPLNPIRNETGDFIYNYSWGFAPSYELSSPSYYYSNPLAAAKLNINRNTSYRGLSRLYTEIKFLKHFSLMPSAGIDFMLTEAKQKLHPKLASGSGDVPPGVGSISENDIRNANIITTNILRYNNQFKGRHTLDVLAGQEAQILSSKRLEATKNDLTQNPDLDHILTAELGTGSLDKQKLLSYFGQATYGFNEKYFVSASARTDGSSLFGKSKRFGTHWSTGVSWVVSSEKFMENTSNWLNYLKIRGSIGSAGNSAAILSTLQYDRVIFGNFLNGTVVYPDPGNPPGNPGIQWEKTFTWDAGLEARLFKDRIALTADIYKRKTSEVIGGVRLPAGTGFYQLIDNLGDLENSGIELSFSADILKSSDFRWNFSANWSKNKNKLIRSFFPLELAESSSALANGTGKNYNSFYLKQWAGVNQADGRPQWIDSTGKPNSDYDAAKKEFVGKPQPDGFGAIRNTFSYKGLELSVMFYYQYGFQVYSNNGTFINDGNDPFINQSREALNRWQKPGDRATNPRRLLFGRDINGSADNGTNLSNRYLEDGDFIRLSSVSLAYSFPKKVLDALHLSMLRVYLQGYNLGLWTNYSGQDPELTNPTGSAGTQYPLQRTYTLGLNVNF